MSILKERNNIIDILRGFAIILVVIGHTMMGSTQNAESSLVYNIIWSLQMPLFFVISGYVNRYSREIDSAKLLGKVLGKRTVSYLLPWFIWSVVIRNDYFVPGSGISLKELAYQMDARYWFLFVLWVIVIFFSAAQFISGKVSRKFRPIVTCVFLGVVMAALLLIGLWQGVSFLGIKYVLFYTPFYLFGYLYSQVKIDWEKYTLAKDILVAACGIVWFIIVLKVNLFNLEDNLAGIIIRFAASLFGCIFISESIARIVNSSFLSEKGNVTVWGRKKLLWLGTHSLEIYLVHIFLQDILQLLQKPLISSVEGIILVIANTILTIVITCTIINLLETNKFLKFILFGRKK